MRRAAALGIVIAAVIFTRRSLHGSGLDERSIGLALGFALLAAALTGDFVERLRLPRVTGYLLFGLVAGPSVSNLISRPMARELRLIDGVAVALIAVMAGLEMNLTRLRPRLWSMFQVGGITIGLMYGALLLLFYATMPWLPFMPDATGLLRFAVAALLAAVVTSFSPTVTIAVVAENRAAGPLTELTLAVVVLGDLALVFGFGAAMQLVRLASRTGPEEIGFLTYMAWEIWGSLAFGALAGAALAIYLRAIGREAGIVLIAVCVVLSEVGRRLHFEPVLAALAAGLVVENIAPPRGDVLKNAVERSALPILILFFAAAGASLRIDALRAIGLLAGFVALVRLLLIRTGTALGTKVARVGSPEGPLVWRGLVSQAGLTLGLTVIVASEYPEWGVAVETLMVAMIALHELVGPILFRSALAEAGEIEKGAAATDAGRIAVTTPPAEPVG
ncbi:MAG: cation:proton antiporter [Betaproteobacteria bacterium]